MAGQHHVWSRVVLLAAVIGVVALPAIAATGPSTTRVSVDSFGKQGDNISFLPSVSTDGRYVAFASAATNLVAGDTNGAVDIFVHDRRTRQTKRVSVSSSGGQADGGSFEPAASADGRLVAFSSRATNLVDSDTNASWDVFVHDLETGQTVRASLASTGAQASLPDARFCGDPAISADGRSVAFSCEAENLVAGDTNGREDVFVRDLKEQTTVRVSVASNGAQANGSSHSPSISADGRRVAFASGATNLVDADGNSALDIFVRDLKDGTTVRASVNSNGGETSLGGASIGPAISADGGFVVFASVADNLVAGDLNLMPDIFIRDLARGQTARVTVNNNGIDFGPLLSAGAAAISGDGLTVAFEERFATGPPQPGVFVKDLRTGVITFAPVSADGLNVTAKTDSLLRPVLSGTGRFVVFAFPEPLDANDTNGMTDVYVRDSGSNASPIASFTAAAGAGSAALRVTVDATRSSDPDGWIESYAWTFGQGGTASGPKGDFGFAAPGTYTVTLTVADNDGATSTASKTVTVTAPPATTGGCTITGTPGADTLRGTPRRDRICGLGGNDRIDGRGGTDVLEGGAGNDVITGGLGRDTLRGGPGNDRLEARDGIADTVDGGPGRDTATVDRGRDRVRNVEVSR